MADLLTTRLTLKKLCPEHAEGLFPIWSDADVIRYTYMRLILNRTACMQAVGNMMEMSTRRGDAGPYTVFLGSAVIGMAGAVRVSKDSGEHELYYHLGKPYWGKGYATEAASAVISEVFASPLVHRISAEVVTENIGSVRVLEKNGMKREGRLRGKFFRDGIYRDLYVYSILRFEWERISEAMSSSESSMIPPGGV